MTELQQAKEIVRSYYRDLDNPKYPDCTVPMCKYCHGNLIWRGFHPFNEIRSPEEVAKRFWNPLKSSLQSMQRRMDLFLAGKNLLDDPPSVWVASMGHMMGLFDSSWLGISPTRKLSMLRYAAFHKIYDGRIGETAMFFDIPHLMVQAGYQPFPKQTAQHLVQPGPVTHDGLMFDEQDPVEGQKTLAAINHMINDIKNWSGGRTEPLLDELRRSWNEDMIWWGPTGIGATYTIERYAQQHSLPFRNAFGERQFNGHLCRIAEGNFGGFFGWPNLTLVLQNEFMGLPPTGKAGDMRVIDMYRRDGDKLTENWIFIDLLHFWKQQGHDILANLNTK